MRAVFITAILALSSCTQMSNQSVNRGNSSGLSDVPMKPIDENVCNNYEKPDDADVCGLMLEVIPDQKSGTAITINPKPIAEANAELNIKLKKKNSYKVRAFVGFVRKTDTGYEFSKKIFFTQNGFASVSADTLEQNPVPPIQMNMTEEDTSGQNPPPPPSDTPTPQPPQQPSGGGSANLASADIALIDSQGGQKLLSQLFSVAAIVDFSGAFCGPCRQFAQAVNAGQYPSISAFANSTNGKCAFVTIAMDEALGNGYTFRSWIDLFPGTAVAKHSYKPAQSSVSQINSTYRVSSYPSIYLVQNGGQVQKIDPSQASPSMCQ